MKWIKLWVMVIGCTVFGVHAEGISLRDDAGNVVSLPQPARRVISLAPSLTEMVFAAGAGDRLVGVVEYSDFPPAANKLPRIGSNQKLDLEHIVALKPDLVLVWYHGNGQREIERLRAIGIPMFFLEPKRIEDVPQAIERIGALTGSNADAARAAQVFRERLAALRSQHAGKTKVRVFYQIWSKPLLTVNGTHLISNVITLCGGENVFAAQPMLVPQLSNESVLAADPQAIFAAHSNSGNDAQPRRNAQAENLIHWQQYKNMQAVRNKQLWTFNGDHISRHGPRILDAVEAVCSALDAVRGT